MIKMNEKLTTLFIGILLVQSCGKLLGSMEAENSWMASTHSSWKHQNEVPVLLELSKFFFCKFVVVKDNLVGVW